MAGGINGVLYIGKGYRQPQDALMICEYMLCPWAERANKWNCVFWRGLPIINSTDGGVQAMNR